MKALTGLVIALYVVACYCQDLLVPGLAAYLAIGYALNLAIARVNGDEYWQMVHEISADKGLSPRTVAVLAAVLTTLGWPSLVPYLFTRNP